MSMQGGRFHQGYTIVEVLIFMAVSSLMFLMAAVFISGKQANVEFRQSMYDVNSQIDDVVNDVADGEYPPLSNVGCIAPLGSPPIFVGLAKAQGTQGGTDGCIFIGKVLVMNPSSNTSIFDVISVVARQLDVNGNPVSRFSVAKPVAAATGASDLTVHKQLSLGLASTGNFLCNSGGGCSSAGAIGFFGSFNANLGIPTGTGHSGAQSVVTTKIPNSNWGDSTATTANNVNMLATVSDDSVTLKNGDYFLFCFLNGSRRGSVTVGGSSGQRFTTKIDIGAGVPAQCPSA